MAFAIKQRARNSLDVVIGMVVLVLFALSAIWVDYSNPDEDEWESM